ncbi:nitrite/sulfite reductase [Microbulbifer thermotolerans]|uniref:Sulfite reductase n=1 Tax=Microbulbifer thermotolerans TaxID=252514 RepID=A0A143HL62_MICTH|nr:nitrite/sulfite reductase [Microbulbifer thermotolerans]AMX02454.1 sulfite reductase [Microbulbifer thermotolerans]MCX2779304.1 nitrite/sulfite reductase [Microbulbifer thermotolerans]MCX2784485.1 nitrite/sulfite reductase [Microbulbifer thermotolerans]MCX2806540.1 nitrite/sulfite reductase [Microbulbifer thermotolerans]MCX2832987.1 nitrite/sulfite reductase [Microbulbifer thermotolerans]
MYRYDERDRAIIRDRVTQFRSQTERYLAGELTEEEFLPLRLQNGLYIQRLAPMLRIAVPYGLLNSTQLRRLARITRDYDKGYAHFTTRHNVQLNWPQLEDVPSILAELAEVDMHSVQTSGNCIRNTTSDPYAGVARDEIADPRPYCELIRQWSTFHPEFAFLPRKFKIAVSGSEQDRAAIRVHDIGVQIVKRGGEIGFQILVGGGLGRTPILAEEIRDFLPEEDLLSYLEAIVRIYNQLGRRDNKFKARIKILVKALGVEEFARRVEDEWARIKDGAEKLTPEALAWAKSFFTAPEYETFDGASSDADLQTQADGDKAFSRWLERNTFPHRVPGYRAVRLSTKPTGVPPGDVTDRQLEAIADLADSFSFGEARVTHDQNVVLADVPQNRLYELWQEARKYGFATPNIGTLTDMICCPGGDYCSLANAKSIPVAEAIQRKFDDLDYLYDLGDLNLNISGCMNACGHHHVGHIGILGVDKKGEEFYQVQLGGSSSENASLAKVLGPSFSRAEVPDVIGKILDLYIEQRQPEEHFLDTYQRIGLQPFKESVYANAK